MTQDSLTIDWRANLNLIVRYRMMELGLLPRENFWVPLFSFSFKLQWCRGRLVRQRLAWAPLANTVWKN